jgi:chromosome partitioning protein
MHNTYLREVLTKCPDADKVRVACFHVETGFSKGAPVAAKIITVFNQKGGCGKTNISVQVGGSLGRRGKRVKIIDADPQNTATRWLAQARDAAPFPARISNLSGLGPALHREIRADLDNFDYIVVDCPPSVDSPIAGSALLVSDLAVIPVVPSPADIWAAVAAKKLAAHAQGTNPSLKVVAVFNMVQRTAMAKGALDVMSEDENVPVLKSQLGLRSAYRECQVMGATVHSVPRAGAAVAEVEGLVDEILKVMK